MKSVSISIEQEWIPSQTERFTKKQMLFAYEKFKSVTFDEFEEIKQYLYDIR